MAYNAQSYYPTIIFQNDIGHVYVKHKPYIGYAYLLRLTTERSSFSPLSCATYIESFFEYDQCMLYIPPPHKLFVISSHLWNCYVRALKCDTGQVKWTFSGPKHSSKFAYCGIVYSQNHGTLLVGGEIIILDPENGKQLQTITLKEFGIIRDMAIHGDQLIVHHVTDKKHKISLVKILSV